MNTESKKSNFYYKRDDPLHSEPLKASNNFKTVKIDIDDTKKRILIERKVAESKDKRANQPTEFGVFSVEKENVSLQTGDEKRKTKKEEDSSIKSFSGDFDEITSANKRKSSMKLKKIDGTSLDFRFEGQGYMPMKNETILFKDQFQKKNEKTKTNKEKLLEHQMKIFGK